MFVPLNGEPASALEGSLAEVQLSTVLSIFEMERRSGVVVLGTDATSGHVMVRAGQVVCATLFAGVRMRGREALFAMLDWRQGRFVFRPCLIDVVDELRSTTTSLLLEAARRSDEGGLCAASL
jgi:Domain of unknown function (DUF4388)